MFFAFPRFYNRLLANLLNESKSHIGDRCRLIHSALLFHLTNDMPEHFLFILIKFQLLKNPFIPFCKLARSKSNRYARICCMVLDEMHDAVQAAMDRAVVILRVTKIRAPRFLLILRHMKRMIDQFADSFIFRSRNRNDRNSEHRFHRIDMNRSSVFAHLIHHVKCQNHRYIKLHELHCQI